MALISTLQLGYSGLGGFAALGSPVAQSVTAGVLTTQVRASGGPPGDGIRSSVAYDWVNSSIVVEFSAVASFTLRLGGYGVGNAPAMIFGATNVLYGTNDAAGEFSALLDTRTGTFRFGRISINAAGTTCAFELSTDGTTWTDFYTYTPPAGMNSCQFQVYGDPTTGSPSYVVNRVNAAATGGAVTARALANNAPGLTPFTRNRLVGV